MKHTDILIIGGGASGLAAAIAAKRTDKTKSVTVLEHLPKVGKKILATGNGRCNLGNMNAAEHAYTNMRFASYAIEKYGTDKLVEFFESTGLYTRADSEGRLYPMSNSAASVLDALRFECENLGVVFCCEEKATEIKKCTDGFTVNGAYRAKSVIIATGGKSAPSQGSDGSGYPLLKSLGHKITALSPSLVQIKTDTAKIKSLKGVRAKASLTLSTGGKSDGEILFTDYGVSGIAAMDLSRFVKPDVKAELSIDLLKESAKARGIFAQTFALATSAPASTISPSIFSVLISRSSKSGSWRSMSRTSLKATAQAVSTVSATICWKVWWTSTPSRKPLKPSITRGLSLLKWFLSAVCPTWCSPMKSSLLQPAKL